MAAERRERFVVLADGRLDIFSAKTAASLIRYRGDEVVAVLDREHAGRPLREVLGVDSGAPILGTLTEALALQPTALVIGISPSGGQLPDSWRPMLCAALQAGLDLISTLHVMLADDPEFAAIAGRSGARIIDLRRPPDLQPIAHGRARETRARRVLTVGTDCNVGKKIAALEIMLAARRKGMDAEFVATGQSGVLISGRGVAIDRVIGDFMAGMAEHLVLEAGDCDLLVVEGQGCLLHPAYSGVSAALLHGVLPDAMVLCHRPGRTVMRSQVQPIPPLNDWITRYEEFVKPLHRGRVVGIALNCFGMDEAEARTQVEAAADETGLPATDVIRFGAESLLRAIQHSGLLAGTPGGRSPGGS
jgi:uncharacterized NAD-dependent epimerase/dehydratase family protein